MIYLPSHILGFAVTLNCNNLMHCVLFVSGKNTSSDLLVNINDKQKKTTAPFPQEKPLYEQIHPLWLHIWIHETTSLHNDDTTYLF